MKKSTLWVPMTTVQYGSYDNSPIWPPMATVQVMMNHAELKSLNCIGLHGTMREGLTPQRSGAAHGICGPRRSPTSVCL